MSETGIWAIAAAICAFVGMGVGLGISYATSKAAEAVARQPEASGKITTVTLIGLALAEATAIYAFVVALIILLLKWV
jgi:F-type H+-transporting ATPase subunit c